jgi:hypothetical protein
MKMNGQFYDAKTFISLKDSFNDYLYSHQDENAHFYLVLDNVEKLISCEKQKKNIEKLMIVTDMVSPLLSVVIIHDTFIDELSKFGSSNLNMNSMLSNYHFIPFILHPMREKNLL